MADAAEITRNVEAAVAAQMSGHTPTSAVETESETGNKGLQPEASEITLNDWEDTGIVFNFDEEFQDKIAALVIRDPDFMRRTRDCVEPGHFDNVGNALVVNMAQSYYDRYHRLPANIPTWAQIIKDAVASNQLREQFKETVVESLRSAFKADIRDADYAIDKISEFSKHQEVMKALEECADLASQGKFEQIERRMQKAFMKSAKGKFREMDYWRDIAKRTQDRKDRSSGLIRPRGIPLGIGKIDDILYHKGLGRRELSVIMGGAKKGKSMGLGEFALRFSRQGYNVLYATLEVAVEIIGERMDANMTDTKFSELDDNFNSIETKIKGSAATAGELKIVEFPTGSLTPNGLRAVIERYKADGIKFDVIITDYADIMAPDHMTSSEIENSKQVWVGLRAIAQEEDAAGLTATQTNREGFKSTVARAEHAAEDFNKIRIADLVISINRTEEERARNEARLFFAASRNQAGEMTILIRQKMESMKFIDKVLQINM